MNYATLLDDESVTLYLGPSDVIRLQQPSNPGAGGGVFRTTAVIDRSVFVEFQTTRHSTHEGRVLNGALCRV